MKKWHVAVITALLFLAAGLLVLDRWLHPFDLAAEIARARAAGIAVTPAELSQPVPPPGNDAAPEWLELTSLMTPGAPLDKAGALRLIHQAASKPAAYFPHRWTADEELPYYGPMRESAALLREESLRIAERGRWVDAVHNQALGYRIARHAAMDPTVTGYLVNLVIDRKTTDGLSDILARSGPNPAVTAAIRAAVQENPLNDDSEIALNGELLFMLGATRNVRSVADILELSGTPPGHIPSIARLRLPAAIWRHGLLEPNAAAYLHYMTRSIEAGRAPAGQRHAAYDSVAQEVAALPLTNPAYVAVKVLSPVYSRLAERHFAELAARRVLLAATEVMDYRSRHGHWPDRLEQAGPEPPMDPFGGGPLLYRRENGGFVVKSMGESDGKPIVFRFPRPTGVQR